jgi:transcriptional regulator GlxA family with amidase domain
MRSLEQLPLEAEALVQALNQCGLGESKSQAEAAWLAMPSVSDDQISGIRSLLALFAVQLETYSQRNWTAGNIEQRRLVWAAKHYLRQHLDRPFALREAAREAGASQRHLQGAFQAVSGVTPREHLSSLRIERAKILLLTSTESISAVAAACGYRSASSFSRTFSQKTRTTPSRYRALAGRASNLNGLVRTAC